MSDGSLDPKLKETLKADFDKQLKEFAKELTAYVSTEDNQWTVKGFIDIFKNIYTISSDTKIISKVLEIHLFPKFLEFAERYDYDMVFAEHQNWYPDISFVSRKNKAIRYAVDLKTTYRLDTHEGFCNGFTLGSHGEYFRVRTSTKNVQFPYGSYIGHFCLGILYSRVADLDADDTEIYSIDKLEEIPSVIEDFMFFGAEKWKIASDRSGSGNTANIGSIDHIEDMLNEQGVFINLGEKIFDDYWTNYGQIMVPSKKGGTKKLTKLEEYLEYRGMDSSKINSRRSKRKTKKTKK
jgi:hypothetical protein